MTKKQVTKYVTQEREPYKKTHIVYFLIVNSSFISATV